MKIPLVLGCLAASLLPAQTFSTPTRNVENPDRMLLEGYCDLNYINGSPTPTLTGTCSPPISAARYIVHAVHIRCESSQPTDRFMNAQILTHDTSQPRWALHFQPALVAQGMEQHAEAIGLKMLVVPVPGNSPHFRIMVTRVGANSYGWCRAIVQAYVAP